MICIGWSVGDRVGITAFVAMLFLLALGLFSMNTTMVAVGVCLAVISNSLIVRPS